MTELVRCDPDEAVARIARTLATAPRTGVLERESVEALDVLYHALTFTASPRALEVWRGALRERTLAADARVALVAMFEHLNAAIDRGEPEAVSEICDCLEEFMGSDEVRRERTGEYRGESPRVTPPAFVDVA